MKCFYHKSDLDGHCSGSIVKYFYPLCEMIGVDYKDVVDRDSIEKDEIIFVVDFCFSFDDMLFLNTYSALTWIDHHKSSIEAMKSFDFKGVQEIGSAACQLTWQYLCNKPIPYSVNLLGMYDIWDFSDEDTLPFQYGIRTISDTRPEFCNEWKNILDGDLSDLEYYLMKGRIILDYETKQNSIYAKGMFFEKDFHGYRAIIINKPYSNSKVFDSVYDPEKHDIMITFGVKDKEFKYTLYSDKPEIDVSEIAKVYGGGGHRGASGFYSDRIIFDY